MKFIMRDGSLFDTDKAELVWTESHSSKYFKVFHSNGKLWDQEKHNWTTDFYVTKKGNWFRVTSGGQCETYNTESIKSILRKYPEIYMKYFKTKKP